MKRLVVLALVLAVSGVPGWGADTLLSQHKLEPGMFVWDGLAAGSDPRQRLQTSVEAIGRLGIHAVRILLSPAALQSYSIGEMPCPQRNRTLECLLRSDTMQRALRADGIHAVMFTAYDFASYRRNGFMNPEFLRAHRQEVFDEYRDLTVGLMKIYAGAGRVFVIGHWEGDNQVYCGSSYDFQTNDGKRYGCLAQNPEGRLEGLKEWLTIRQAAIEAGRKAGVAAGYQGVEVYHAVECNTIFGMRGVSGASMGKKEYKGILNTVVPAVHPDICSYSAWESSNRNRITKDLQDIAKVCGPAPVVVGELGAKENQAKRYKKMVVDLRPLREIVPFVFFYQAFEPPTAKERGFGLLKLDGSAVVPAAVDAIVGLGK